MSDDLAARAKEIIESVVYINIATASGAGSPWNTPVYAVHDETYNFFWSSWSEAEHSKNIKTNSSVFITVYDSTRTRGDNHLRGLYIQATAEELINSEDIDHALKYFTSVDGTKPKPTDFSGDNVKRLYKAVPQKMWLNDISESQVTKETIKMRIDVPVERLTNPT